MWAEYWLGCYSSKLHGSQENEPCMGQPHCAWLWSGQRPRRTIRGTCFQPSTSPLQNPACSKLAAAIWRRGEYEAICRGGLRVECRR